MSARRKTAGTMVAVAAAMAAAVGSTACSNERRPVGPDLPLTPPRDAADPRIERYQRSAYQVSQGGRYYAWYGCGHCHASGAAGGPDLGLGRWRHGDGFDAVYAFVARGHSAAEQRIPVEQLWQITAYVRNLPTLDAGKRRRQDLDAAAEPQGRQGPTVLR